MDVERYIFIMQVIILAASPLAFWLICYILWRDNWKKRERKLDQ